MPDVPTTIGDSSVGTVGTPEPSLGTDHATTDEERLLAMVAEHGPCTCPPDDCSGDDGGSDWDCALCAVLDPEWPCPHDETLDASKVGQAGRCFACGNRSADFQSAATGRWYCTEDTGMLVSSLLDRTEPLDLRDISTWLLAEHRAVEAERG